MGKIKAIDLSAEQMRVPENGYKHGRAHFLRQRCLAVLLKSQGLSPPQIALKVDLWQQSINKWVDRFPADEKTIRKAIEADRQSVKAAKAAWEASSDKRASEETFRRFLYVFI
jgi:hypothetical protein